MVRIATRSLPVVTGPAKAAVLVVTKFNAEVRAVLEQPEFRAKLLAQGADPAGELPQEFAAFFRAETVKREKVVIALGRSQEFQLSQVSNSGFAGLRRHIFLARSVLG